MKKVSPKLFQKLFKRKKVFYMKLEETLYFPEGFLWGTASSAHQAEGNNIHNDWWAFEQQPGRIKNEHKSGKANNHYELFRSDFKLLKALNNNAHRLGIEWSRIFPDEDKINHKEIDHYKKVLDTAKEVGLTVFATTHHFSSPLWFANKGGFLIEKNLDYFKRYIEIIARELSPHLEFWNTINEPAVYATMGWLAGEFPPGHKDIVETLTVMKNIILAHAIAYHGLHEHSPNEVKVGIVKNIPHFVPKDPNNPEDVKTAQSQDEFFNEYHLRAIAEGVLQMGDKLEEVPSLKGSTDFYGINYYMQMICDSTKPMTPATARENELISQMGWGTHPQGLFASLFRLKKYGKPIYITENGIATNDEQWRINYLALHFKAMHNAIKEGADVRGYFHWTSVDNFEWAQGWTPKFGIIAFDPTTFKRTVKKGGFFFEEVAGSNSLTQTILDKYLQG